MLVWVSLTCLFLSISPIHGFIEGLYCGNDNCYELLGVSRDISKSDMSKAYRKLAGKWHPDRFRKKEDKEKAHTQFQAIANAYEVLKDDESRKDYDYMLDNPEEYYQHYYRYYRHRVAPRVDVRLVVVVVITVISAVQYWGAWNNYNAAILYLLTVPKYRLQATDIARKEGLLDTGKRKRDKTRTKEEIREEEETVLKKVLEEKMDIRGGYQRPSIYSLLWLQLVLSPYYLVCYIIWFVDWTWRFTIKREEYGDTEKAYIMRKRMKLSQAQWDSLEDHQVDEFLHEELWIASKFKAWQLEKEEEKKTELAQNARYRSYRRYMKKGGPGQMTFGPE